MSHPIDPSAPLAPEPDDAETQPLPPVEPVQPTPPIEASAPASPMLPELAAQAEVVVPSGQPVPFGAPYRTAEPSQIIVPGYAYPAVKRPRPVIGPTLSVFAVLLWSFVVAGQFTTSWSLGAGLSQSIAFGAIMLATFTAWVVNLRRGHLVMPAQSAGGLMGRGIGIALLAALLFTVCLAFATVAGQVASHDHDLFIAFVLVLVSTLAAFMGARLTSPAPIERSHRGRFILVAMWVAGALLTFVAGIDLAANG